MIDGLKPRAPDESAVTEYDRRHATIYLRLLDAEKAHAPWSQVAQVVLGLDPDSDPQGAREVLDSHLERARWMTTNGYRQFVAEGERAG